MTDHQKLRSLRRFITSDDAHYPRMKKLKVKGRDLQNLAKEVFFLTELEVLDLSPEREACLEYHLDELPSDISRLINLRVLMMDTNELYDVPDSLTRLSKLEKLSLSNNHIQTLPVDMGRLTNMTSLHLSNNRFKELPRDVFKLSNLEFLDISDNEFTSVPSDIARLRKMHTFIMFQNKVTSLPDSITELTNLRCLWLGNNRLTSLPKRFGNLNLTDWDNFGRHMFSTIIDGNPMTDPPMDVCKQGIRAIAQYFGGNRDASDTVRYDGSGYSSPPPADVGGRSGANVSHQVSQYPSVPQSRQGRDSVSRTTANNSSQPDPQGRYFPVGTTDQVSHIGYQQSGRQAAPAERSKASRNNANNHGIGLTNNYR